MLAYEHMSRVMNFAQEEYRGHVSAETCVVSLQWCFGHMWYKHQKKKRYFLSFRTTLGMSCNC